MKIDDESNTENEAATAPKKALMDVTNLTMEAEMFGTSDHPITIDSDGDYDADDVNKNFGAKHKIVIDDEEALDEEKEKRDDEEMLRFYIEMFGYDAIFTNLFSLHRFRFYFCIVKFCCLYFSDAGTEDYHSVKTDDSDVARLGKEFIDNEAEESSADESGVDTSTDENEEEEEE